MIMDWDSHINVKYSGSAYCALYLYKYCYKGAARKERIDLGSEQEHDSLDEIKLFIYSRIMCSMAAFGGCMDIRIILCQNHQFVCLKYAVELN